LLAVFGSGETIAVSSRPKPIHQGPLANKGQRRTPTIDRAANVDESMPIATVPVVPMPIAVAVPMDRAAMPIATVTMTMTSTVPVTTTVTAMPVTMATPVFGEGLAGQHQRGQ
jgi:hypothetical protein